MRARRFAPFLICGLLLLAGCQTVNTISGWLGNRVAFTAPQLQRYLDNSFPREFDKMGGLVSARLSNPRISLPAGDTRLRLDFDVGLGAMGSSEMRSGRFALASNLRYDPTTQGLHLQDPELLSVDIPGSGPLLQGGTRQLLNTVLAEYARQVPVYRLDSELLRKLPSGKRIASTGIENGLVVVRLD